jgi:protein-disulfide isomerase
VKVLGCAALVILALVAMPAAPTRAGAPSLESVIERLPQRGLVLGDPGAPVELVEFGDLQCPICREWAELRLPQVIRGPVAAGEVRFRFAPFDIISPQSTGASAAALAAGEQGHGWQFIQAFFHDQGEEGDDYVDPKFLDAIAERAGVPNLGRFDAQRTSARLIGAAKASTKRAGRLGFEGTPSFTLRGPGTKGLERLGTPTGTKPLLAAIHRAAG